LDPTVVEALYRQRQPRDEQRIPLGAVRFFKLAFGADNIIGAALHTGSGGDERLIEVFKDESAPDVLIGEIVREFPFRSMRVMLPLLALLLLAGGAIVHRRMRPIAEVSRLA